MIKELLTNPFYAIISVIALWQILNLILIRGSNLSRKTWLRLEYIWIVIGFMGVISIIVENDMNYKKGDLKFAEKWLENQFEILLNFSERETVCFQYTRSDWMPAEEFNKLQSESDRICKWVEEQIVPALKESKKREYSKVDNFENIHLGTSEGNNTYNRIDDGIISINEYIEKRDELKKAVTRNNWSGFQYSLGVILLIFAFSLRLTLVTKKVMYKSLNNE